MTDTSGISLGPINWEGLLDAIILSQDLIAIVCYLAAAIFFIVSLHSFTQVGEPGSRSTPMGASFGLLFAALLIALPSTIEALSTTMFNQTPVNVLSYADSVSNSLGLGDQAKAGLRVAVAAVNLMGLISIVRGLFLGHSISRGTAAQGSSYGTVATLLVAGGLAMNIALVADVFHSLLPGFRIVSG